ncbi:hypothetical protein CEQ30_35015 [Nocardia brasiliensis]|nr:hypothetical protein CEQ30_35015 [Nocardia brasiliensis]SUB09505.1 Uncharacterised protein [Nocardia brasiliensis]
MLIDWSIVGFTTVDLPDPQLLWDDWAVCAAVDSAARDGSSVEVKELRARYRFAHYDDGGGNWAELVLLPENRAVLCGRDLEFSRTYFRESMDGVEEIDVLAGVPDWWRSVIDDLDNDPASWAPVISFTYGFDGSHWRRVDYDVDDGFAGAMPDVGDFVREILMDAAQSVLDEDDEGLEPDRAALEDFEPDDAALEALWTAGRHLTAGHLRAAFGPVAAHCDVDRGVRAAAEFR